MTRLPIEQVPTLFPDTLKDRFVLPPESFKDDGKVLRDLFAYWAIMLLAQHKPGTRGRR